MRRTAEFWEDKILKTERDLFHNRRSLMSCSSREKSSILWTGGQHSKRVWVRMINRHKKIQNEKARLLRKKASLENRLKYLKKMRENYKPMTTWELIL